MLGPGKNLTIEIEQKLRDVQCTNKIFSHSAHAHNSLVQCFIAVSYTHLDVYKRQEYWCTI